MSDDATVRLWDRTIGAVSLESGAAAAIFQYDPRFVRSGIRVSPLTMPPRVAPYVFPNLSEPTFKRLPGLLADSLPDRFGSAVFDTWLASQGRRPDTVSAVERLCYMGTRGMGALEFEPAIGPSRSPSDELSIGKLVELASAILSERQDFITRLKEGREEAALLDILSVGASAGGARAKAVVAWNPETGSIRSGQVDAGPEFEHWLLKFDGVTGVDANDGLEEPQGYGAIEYAYSKMALEAGLTMSKCRLLKENGREHFMTRRFDRPAGNTKLHAQSLGALAHYDFNQPGAHSYEQALLAMRQLGLPMAEIEQQFRRMAFNVIARNQDDHVKNIAFLMDPEGRWSLSPAFDVTYAYRPSGGPTALHQMSINGKQDGFEISDLKQCAEVGSMKRGRVATIVGEVREAVANWPGHAAEAGVREHDIERIGQVHRLDLGSS
ncbi:MAG: type II toxin-antitoxin system HipA family toxin [Solirubrobacterales bacterium]